MFLKFCSVYVSFLSPFFNNNSFYFNNNSLSFNHISLSFHHTFHICGITQFHQNSFQYFFICFVTILRLSTIFLSSNSFALTLVVPSLQYSQFNLISFSVSWLHLLSTHRSFVPHTRGQLKIFQNSYNSAM